MTVSPNTELNPVHTVLATPGSILRQYEAPTCKLEISANPSALSHWARKLALKNQRFLLKFEDPRVSEDQWSTLRGDRLKLEALTEAVATYVQNFLSQSQNLNRSEDQSDLTGIIIPESSSQSIFLQPKGLLSHTLHLGPIASDLAENAITLSSTQLADLASVLDEHSSETIAIPSLNADRAWVRSPVAWGKIAALSLLSVGVTATVLRQFDPKPAPSLIASQASDQRLPPPPIPQPTPTNPLIPPNALPGVQLPPIAANPNSLPTTSNSVTVEKNPPTSSNPPASDDKPTNKPKLLVTTPPESTRNEVNGSQENATAKKTGSNQSLSGQPQPAPPNPNSAPITPIPGSRKSADQSSNADNDPQPPIDLTTQIGEIQSNVPKKWTPPEKFSGEIKYLMEVSAAGSIISVTLEEGQDLPAAQTVLPGNGKTVAPALLSKNSEPYRVRIFFYSDGTVNVKRAY